MALGTGCVGVASDESRRGATCRQVFTCTQYEVPQAFHMPRNEDSLSRCGTITTQRWMLSADTADPVL